MVDRVWYLFCLFEGETSQSMFPVKVDMTMTVYHLKQLIKTEKPHEFENINTNEFTLWRILNTSTNEKEELLCFLRNLNGLGVKERLRPSAPLSWVLRESLTGNTDKICILIQRPSPRLLDVPASEVVALPELKSSPVCTVALGIVEKRRGKEVVCTFVTDSKQATVKQLRTLLNQHIEQLDGEDIIQINVYLPGDSKPICLSDDIILCSCLELAKANDWKNLTISLDIPAKSFSAYTWREMMVQYGVGKGPEFLPSFDIHPRWMSKGERITSEEIAQECSRRSEAYILGPSSNTFTRNTIVEALMVGTMQFYKQDMYLAQQQDLSGRRGHGQINLAVLDRVHSTHVLGVIEVARDDLVQGLVQCMVQLDAVVHQEPRRRVEDEEGSPKRPKSYGIVTDMFKWTFVECTLEEDDTLTYKVKEVMENFRLKQGEEALREDTEILLAYILSLYDRMKGKL